MRVESSPPSRLDLHIDSDWSEMGGVYTAVREFLENVGFSRDSVDAYTMVACELVENGIKYGSFVGSGACVEVTVTIDNRFISFSVRNPVTDASAPYLRELDRVIQWVRGYQDPFEAYIARMKAISSEPLDMRDSGLGIVRMAYEGRASLDFFLEENAILNVSAVTQLS